MSTTDFCYETLSESQTAMLKTHLETLLIKRFNKSDFHKELQDLLSLERFYYPWYLFDDLHPITETDFMSNVLKLLERTMDDIFVDMPIVIHKKNTAKKLSLQFDDNVTFPHVFSGADIFPLLCRFSLVALYALEPSLPCQLWHKTHTTSFPLTGKIEMAAKSGYVYNSDEYDEFEPSGV